jgi:protein O-GlcNAc transferase
MTTASDALLSAASALLRTSQFASAERLLGQAAATSGDARAWIMLGVAQHALGKREDARRSLLEALALDPGSADAHFNLGILADAQRDLAGAQRSYERALQLEPAHGGARRNLGAVRLDLGDAAGALWEFDRLAATEDSAALQLSRARALFALFRDQDALAAAERAQALEPQAPVPVERVIALSGLGRLDEAARLLGGMLPAPPGVRFDPRSLWVGRMMQQQWVCDWRQRGALIETLRGAAASAAPEEVVFEPGMLIQLVALPLGADALRALGEGAMKRSRAAGAAISAGLPPLSQAPVRRRFRVGFLAASLREHPEAYLLRRVLTDRDRERFEYFLYALNPSDGSALRRELEGTVDQFVDLSSEDSRTIAARIRADALDLLVDRTGANVDTRPEVVAARVAPVQVAYLATPTTLGSGLHDYRLSDASATPLASQDDWWERLVLLPPVLPAYDNALAPGAAGTRAQHGLPESGAVLCAMHPGFKIEPDAWSIWMRLLDAVPGSVLWLLDESPVMRLNLAREAGVRGIARDRLVFAPRLPLAAHLGRMAHASLFLDTLHCAAHTTALDALWAGVPVLTREGTTMAGRMAAGYVRAAGLPELVVPSSAEYEAEALALLRAPGRLGMLRSKLLAARASAPAFQTVERVRVLERAFATMIERQRAGLPPRTLEIGPA